MVGWHDRLNGREFECTLGDGDRQGGLACCNSWGLTESDMTEANQHHQRSLKKIRDTKRTFHAKMGTIKERNSMDLTEAEDIKKRWQKYTELFKKELNDPDN